MLEQCIMDQVQFPHLCEGTGISQYQNLDRVLRTLSSFAYSLCFTLAKL